MSERKWHHIQGSAHRTERWVMLLSEHLYPQVFPIIPLYSQYNMFPLYILPRFNPCLVEGRLRYASCCQQPTVTALSAIPLIIAQRSPCVEPNHGVLGVSGAETSEESPLKDNQNCWLTAEHPEGDPCFSHEYKCDIDRKSSPGERTEDTEQVKESENKWVQERARGLNTRFTRFASHR